MFEIAVFHRVVPPPSLVHRYRLNQAENSSSPIDSAPVKSPGTIFAGARIRMHRQLSTSVDLSGSPLQHRVCDLPLSRQCIYTNPSSSPARESQLSRTFLIIFLIAGSTRVFAQTLIDGTVRAADGNPLSGACVNLLRQDGGPLLTTSTTRDGSFHFSSLQA